MAGALIAVGLVIWIAERMTWGRAPDTVPQALAD
jgi:hypothetical protein